MSSKLGVFERDGRLYAYKDAFFEHDFPEAVLDLG